MLDKTVVDDPTPDAEIQQYGMPSRLKFVEVKHILGQIKILFP